MKFIEDFQKELEERNISIAIKSKPTTSLQKILAGLDHEDLLLTATQNGVREGYIVRKEILIKRLMEQILRERRITESMIALRPGEYDLFLNLLEKKYIKDNRLPCGTYGYLMDHGIVYSFYDKGDVLFLVPEEVKKAFNKIKRKSLEIILKRNQIVHKYISAMLNLYGVFTKEVVIEIFNKQNKEALDPEELEFILGVYLSRQQAFHVTSDFIIDNYFDEDNYEEIGELLEYSREIPYFIPEKKELLNYADTLYCEKTPQLKALEKVICKEMDIDPEEARELGEEIQMLCCMEYSMQDIIFEFERRRIFFKSMEQYGRMAKAIEDVYINSRTWFNKGHTHTEMLELNGMPLPRIADEQVELLINGKPVVKKIGRNDPCPCGSGKKYKKCCGNQN